MINNSDDVFEIIEYIAATSSTKAKQDIIEACLETELFKKVIKFACEPLLRFGLLDMPAVTSGYNTLNDESWRILDCLASGEVRRSIDTIDLVTDHLGSLTADSQELFRRILKKDLRAGFGTAIINKASKKVNGSALITDFPYMRCSLPKHVNLEEWPWASGIDSEVKLDGMFASLSVVGSGGQMHTRKGQLFDLGLASWEGLNKDIRLLPPGFRFSGELIVVRNGQTMKRQTGNGFINALLNGNDTLPDDCHVAYTVWDMVPLQAAADNFYDRTRAQRKAALLSILSFQDFSDISFVETRQVFSLEEAQAHAQEVMDSGGEGTVLKHPNGLWKKTTSKHEIKIKAEHTADLRMLSLTPGTGKNEATFGSITCATDDGNVIVDVSGYTDELRKDIYENWENVYEGRLMELTFNDLLSKRNRETFSLFLPRFKDFRLDKDDTDSYESIKAMI